MELLCETWVGMSSSLPRHTADARGRVGRPTEVARGSVGRSLMPATTVAGGAREGPFCRRMRLLRARRSHCYTLRAVAEKYGSAAIAGVTGTLTHSLHQI
jgi:hypothetical protein